MADATYGPKVYQKQGGDELVVASGGTLTLESGSTFTHAGTVAFSGSQTFDDIVGNDSSLGITGLAVTGGTGGAVVITGGATTTSGVGGAASLVGGAGSGTDAGGAIAVTGGGSGAGATGNGGAVAATGGAALSTNGTGGAASLTGGVATGTGTGGAVTLLGGASAGGTGTAGSVVIDPGAAAGGTAGEVRVCRTNGTLKVGSNATDAVAIKGIYMNPSVLAVAVPTIANDAAENVDEVAVDVSTAFSMQPAVGDAVIAIPQEALPTDCVLCGAWVSATDQITVSFASKEGGGGVTGANKNFKFLVYDLT